MTEQQLTDSTNLNTTLMYFAYPDDDLTKPGRPVPGLLQPRQHPVRGTSSGRAPT